MSPLPFSGSGARDLLRMAYDYASKRSTDASSQNAAFLVDHHGFILVRAVNAFPAGVKELPGRLDRPEKYQWYEHAERNAIFAAARLGVRTEGLVMVCPWFACAECGRAIVQSGVAHVVGHDPGVEAHGDWAASIARASAMFAEAGVGATVYGGRLGAAAVRRNGVLIHP